MDAELEEGRLILYAPNQFMAEWLKGHLQKQILEAAAAAASVPEQDMALEIRAGAGRAAKCAASAAAIIKNVLPEKARPVQATLPIPAPAASVKNWRYKFEDFVIGSSNSFAVAAARDLCQTGQVRSLFLTSASGLGKTHLAQAAGQMISEAKSPVKVAYITAENFASRYVAAMRARDLESLKSYLCSLDALIFEDVHFLQKKKAMQELALTVIKNLEAKGARVIFTSSFAPRCLQDMDEQLSSYFRSGIMANMDKPDCEMRKEILQRKAKSYQVHLPDAVCDVLSRNVSTDIRQLEACLQNMIFKAKLLNSGLTVDLAMEASAQYGNNGPSLDLNGIVKLVCESFGVSETQLKSRSRKHDYVQCRNMVFFLARKHTDLSLEHIGSSLNRRHSTVLRSITQMERELARESREGRQMARTMELIEKKCGLTV